MIKRNKPLIEISSSTDKGSPVTGHVSFCAKYFSITAFSKIFPAGDTTGSTTS